MSEMSLCIICNKPAKTIYNDQGQVIMQGIHRICAQQVRVQLDETHKKELKGDN